MKIREWSLLIIVFLCIFVGIYFAYITSFSVLEIAGINLESRATIIELIGLLIFITLWYPLWCFIGLLAGLAVARPICGASAISALGVAGHKKVPVLSSIYYNFVNMLYEQNT